MYICIVIGSMFMPGMPDKRVSLKIAVTRRGRVRLTHHRKVAKPVLHGHHHRHLVKSRGEAGRGKCAAHSFRLSYAGAIGVHFFNIAVLVPFFRRFGIVALNKLGALPR